MSSFHSPSEPKLNWWKNGFDWIYQFGAHIALSLLTLWQREISKSGYLKLFSWLPCPAHTQKTPTPTPVPFFVSDPKRPIEAVICKVLPESISIFLAPND